MRCEHHICLPGLGLLATPAILLVPPPFQKLLLFALLAMLGFYVARRPNPYPRTDANDDSLRKWKESLGLGSGTDLSDGTDRTCIIQSLGLEVLLAMNIFFG